MRDLHGARRARASGDRHRPFRRTDHTRRHRGAGRGQRRDTVREQRPHHLQRAAGFCRRRLPRRGDAGTPDARHPAQAFRGQVRGAGRGRPRIRAAFTGRGPEDAARHGVHTPERRRVDPSG